MNNISIKSSVILPHMLDRQVIPDYRWLHPGVGEQYSTIALIPRTMRKNQVVIVVVGDVLNLVSMVMSPVSSAEAQRCGGRGCWDRGGGG